MREEIAAAVVFLKRLMQKCESLPSGKLEIFTKCLSSVLIDRFRDHWYKERPTRGQGYRCITFSPAEPVDPVLERAACESGINLQEPLLPIEMTLWVDPNEVCCRFGDIKANYCMVATMKNGSLDNKAHTLDVSDLILQAKELYNKQLNITTTRVNSNSKPLDKPKSWQVPTNSRPVSQTDNHHFTNNHNNNTSADRDTRPVDNSSNNSNKKFFNQNHRRQQQFNNFNNRQPFGQLDNGRPFIPPDFSVPPPPPPPPMGFKPWQAPGAYSPPAKNKNLNTSFRNKGFNYKHGHPKLGQGVPPNNDRFHWQKDLKTVS
ncbi:protein BTG3-like [Haliotis rubra]|uniref:protein BTG3-like n=1 Tax=Haliotis rubra TaxID=36100 RepID=UPI001EE550BC|nr:protein BTG3-like [Haliotis rubra]